jgi:hypothetical protein
MAQAGRTRRAQHCRGVTPPGLLFILQTLRMMMRMSLAHTGRGVVAAIPGVFSLFAPLARRSDVRVPMPLADAAHDALWISL